MIKDRLQYYLVLLFAKFIMILPKKVRRGFFKSLAYLTFLLYKKNRRVIEQNLLYVYDNNISKEKIKEIQKSCYKKLFLNILSIIENEYLTPKEIEKMVTFEGKEYLDSMKKPFIFVTAHLGNLEILGLMIGYFFGNTTHIHQKIKNPLLHEYMTKQREKYGITLVEKHGAIKKLFSALRKGEVVSLVIDQSIREESATKVKFLGKETYQLVTSAQFAKKFDIPILPVFIIGENDSYKVIFKKPIYPKNKTIEELNQIQADIISKMIFKYPKEWFWCHKRFKNSNPEIYQ